MNSARRGRALARTQDEGAPTGCDEDEDAARHVIRPANSRRSSGSGHWAYLGRDDAYPWGFPRHVQEAILEDYEQHWGTGRATPILNPGGVDDPVHRDWYAKLERHLATPRVGRLLQQFSFELDVRAIAPAVSVPTLVIHVRDNRWVRAGHGRWLADTIPGARYVEVEGDGHWWWASDASRAAVVDAAEEFLTGEVHARADDRVLATVLFTDVVGSTDHAAALGDSRWAETLDRLDATVRGLLERHRGQLVKHTGDGHLATFDGPGRAIRCAQAVRDAVRQLGLDLRTGLHTGEVEVRGEDVAGIAVHIAARVMAEAGAGEIVVSGAVPPLVVGSGIEFADREVRKLKGVPGEWRLFLVS